MGSGVMGNEATSIEFRHFDSVPAAADHYFINTKSSNNSKNATIMREWGILEHNLPDSIYVQVYETRIDLLRAVIIGSAGTPYKDGLFFFDIFLPSDYPNQPPLVYYHSHGYRLNPNLYENGLLCLSLINTWGGSGAEKWTNGSTLLQLLVSIQGLVLNSRPYFNEPDYKVHQGSERSVWIKRANRYNERAFICSCRTMQKIMQRPPHNFERFVVEHFRQRAAFVLEAIDHYQQGMVPAGELGMHNKASSSSSAVRVSSKFKADLGIVGRGLELAFAPFGPFSSKARATSTFKTKKQHKKGLLTKITSFVNKIWNSTSED